MFMSQCSTTDSTGIERQPVVGELLDPKVFPDYTGAPAFALVHGKAVQQDYRRRDNSLIPCGTTASVVREGALVLAKMSLHAFNIPDPKNGHGKRVRELLGVILTSFH